MFKVLRLKKLDIHRKYSGVLMWWARSMAENLNKCDKFQHAHAGWHV